MKLTEEEKKIILNKRKEEESNLPKKRGILKHNLYYNSHNIFGINNYLFTEKQKNDLINDFASNFTLVPKGTEFICYLDEGDESWYDCADGCIEAADSDFAKQNLEKIEIIRKKNNKL